MALDSRFQSILDDFDDFPFDPSLRIPPLQDPIPLIPSRRPSPLEPNARVNDGTHSATAKLTSRSKALAEALPIDDGPPGLYHSRAKSNIPSTKSVAPPEAPRKRQKIELPKPTTRSKTNKPPPFNPIPALNEPPPSAALFPPITPNALYDTQDQTQHQPSLLKTNFARRKSSPIPVEDPVPEIIEKEVYGKGKRVYTRGRRHWTDSETEDLLKGIGIYGVGKWKKILNHERFSFHQERTTVDLKDR